MRVSLGMGGVLRRMRARLCTCVFFCAARDERTDLSALSHSSAKLVQLPTRLCSRAIVRGTWTKPLVLPRRVLTAHGNRLSPLSLTTQERRSSSFLYFVICNLRRARPSFIASFTPHLIKFEQVPSNVK